MCYQHLVSEKSESLSETVKYQCYFMCYCSGKHKSVVREQVFACMCVSTASVVQVTGGRDSTLYAQVAQV